MSYLKLIFSFNWLEKKDGILKTLEGLDRIRTTTSVDRFGGGVDKAQDHNLNIEGKIYDFKSTTNYLELSDEIKKYLDTFAYRGIDEAKIARAIRNVNFIITLNKPGGALTKIKEFRLS